MHPCCMRFWINPLLEPVACFVCKCTNESYAFLGASFSRCLATAEAIIATMPLWPPPRRAGELYGGGNILLKARNLVKGLQVSAAHLAGAKRSYVD